MLNAPSPRAPIVACLLAILLPALTLHAQQTITIHKPVIVCESTDVAKTFAAQELGLHLRLITGQDVPIVSQRSAVPGDGYALLVGIAPQDAAAAPLHPEEGRYHIDATAAWFYGEDSSGGDAGNLNESIFRTPAFRTGTLFAVYYFLENELGVRWIEPGDDQIVYTAASPLVLNTRSFAAAPRLSIRLFRHLGWEASSNRRLPQQMQYTAQELEGKLYDLQLWKKRHRSGRSEFFDYGHAFTTWWNRYGGPHPEYFAYLQSTGQRGPAPGSRPERVKLCVSNADLHRAIVAENRSRAVLNLSENDSAGFCECPACTALDVALPDESQGAHLTDRYLWFAEQVLALARQERPDVRGTMYAYSNFQDPPRRQRVPQGLILGMVPTCLLGPAGLQAYYQGWRDAGATQMFLRPNDLHMDPGLPIGFEKTLFDSFKIAVDHGGIIGVDYDALHGFWPTTGLASYVLVRGSIDPQKPFEHWEDEYCSAYGAAADDVKAYYRHWRSIWETRIFAQREAMLKAARYGNFRRGFVGKLSEYYREADFSQAAALLDGAAGRTLTEAQRDRLQRLKLSLEHARLTYNAIATFADERSAAAARFGAARAVLAYRTEHRDRLNINWPALAYVEAQLFDPAGVHWSLSFDDQHMPVSNTALQWVFKIDPANAGLQENWQSLTWNQVAKLWAPISTSAPWEQQTSMPAELLTQLRSYDGIGWYAAPVRIDPAMRGRPFYLCFGAVDESCWVYVNGKLVGQRLFEKPDDWTTPFTIRIDEAFIDQVKQTVIVRVEDRAGQGGIWKPVWLAAPLSTEAKGSAQP